LPGCWPSPVRTTIGKLAGTESEPGIPNVCVSGVCCRGRVLWYTGVLNTDSLRSEITAGPSVGRVQAILAARMQPGALIEAVGVDRMGLC
jgi:hypothetical protein